MPESALLSLQSIGFERDDLPLFAGISADICSGDIVQVQGPNGAGKTTLIRILAASLAATEGALHWRGEPVASNRLAYLSDILFIGYNPGVKPGLTPRENLDWWAKLQSLESYDDSAVLAELGLEGFEDVPCYQLSAGQLRRVALCRMLVSRASLWILDEPFTAIDAEGVEQLQQLMQQHAARSGAVVFSSHQQAGLQGVRRLDLLDYRVSESVGAGY